MPCYSVKVTLDADVVAAVDKAGQQFFKAWAVGRCRGRGWGRRVVDGNGIITTKQAGQQAV